jgi:hypothetical protein
MGEIAIRQRQAWVRTLLLKKPQFWPLFRGMSGVLNLRVSNVLNSSIPTASTSEWNHHEKRRRGQT